ncbi:hypothetical protein DPMN_020257 [Dreissena polymorpha]|uniref:Uncharacterized protein n=1 Tax=Dreissena polymorpha TaxID=45954 RepID=A0A9D4S818_DREPO|nr:hypothetical protein DPMN_020257 [Dreissena polymorpha]
MVVNPFYRLFFQESENGVWKLWMRRYQIYWDAREWGPFHELKSEALCDEIEPTRPKLFGAIDLRSA